MSKCSVINLLKTHSKYICRTNPTSARGCKLFVLSGNSGCDYCFKLFNFQENNAEICIVTEPDLWVSANFRH